MSWRFAVLLLLAQAVIFAIISAAQAVEIPQKGAVIELTPYQLEQCRKEGGCVVVSKERAKGWIAEAFQAGVEHQRVQCRRFL